MVTTNDVLAHFDDSDLAVTTILDLEEFSEDILEHYGVKGMRWGVRKDRKKSSDKKTSATGSVGDSVKKAISNTSSSVKSVVKKRKEKRAAAVAEAERQEELQKPLSDALKKHKKNSSNTINEKYKNLTNDDLRALNERMRLEKEYDELAASRAKQNRTTAEKMANWATETTTSVASDLAKQQIRKYGEKILSNAIKAPAPKPKPSKSTSSEAIKKLLIDAGTKSLSSISSSSTKTTGNAVSARELIDRYGGRPPAGIYYKGRHRK